MMPQLSHVAVTQEFTPGQPPSQPLHGWCLLHVAVHITLGMACTTGKEGSV